MKFFREKACQKKRKHKRPDWPKNLLLLMRYYCYYYKTVTALAITSGNRRWRLGAKAEE